MRKFKKYINEKAGWETKPEGWDVGSVKKFGKTLTGQEVKKKGFVDKCIRKMEGKVDNPGAYCASLKSTAVGTEYWRGKGKKKIGKVKEELEQYISSEETKELTNILEDEMRFEDLLKEQKPGAHLTPEKRSEIVKKAKKGEDIGKPGKKFKEVAEKAKKGKARDPEAVAAAAMWKGIKSDEEPEGSLIERMNILLHEKWPTKHEVPEAEKGKYEGKSVEELKAMKKKPGADLKEINFAIRAKKAGGKKWAGVTAEDEILKA